MVNEIEIAWAGLTIFCLVWASIEDLKHRLVRDKIWLIQILGGITIFFWWTSISVPSDLILMAVINITLAIILAYLFFVVGSLGGGDSKAIIAIAVSSPIAISSNLNKSSIPFFPPILYILANMMLGLLIFTFLLLILNIIQIRRFGPLFSETSGSVLSKINVLISARRIPIEQIVHLKHEDPAEIYENNKWKLYTPVFQEPLEDEEYERVEKEARENAIRNTENTERSYLWVRPQPPGIIFLTLGYIYWVFIGSPLALFFVLL